MNGHSTTWDPVVYDSSLTFDDMTWQLVRVKTPGDFYVEEYQPCWYRSADALWLKNLEVSQVFVAAVSGKLDLSNYTAGDPPTLDSPFWVVDLSGRAYRLDADSPSVSGSILLLGVQGTFQVWYKSQNRLNKLRAGSIFARFNEQIIPLTETPLTNPWTAGLTQNSPLVRGLRFTNTEVKAQLQAWSLSFNEQFRIAALLGLTSIAAWDTQTAVALTGSSVQVSKVWPFNYLSERPILTDEGLRVTRLLHEPVELWWSNQLIDPSAFTVSNTGILLKSDYLTEAQQQELWVKYKTVNYQSTGLVLVGESIEGRNRYIVETSGVEIDTGTLKIDWIWDRSPENTEGTVIFT